MTIVLGLVLGLISLFLSILFFSTLWEFGLFLLRRQRHRREMARLGYERELLINELQELSSGWDEPDSPVLAPGSDCLLLTGLDCDGTPDEIVHVQARRVRGEGRNAIKSDQIL